MSGKPYNKTFQHNMICGRLTKDPDFKILGSGKKVCNFTLAVNKEAGNANFIPCVAWEEKAQRIYDHVKKGALVLCEGEIKSSSFKDSEDRPQYKLQYELTKYGILHFLDNKKPDLSGLEELPSDLGEQS